MPEPFILALKDLQVSVPVPKSIIPNRGRGGAPKFTRSALTVALRINRVASPDELLPPTQRCFASILCPAVSKVTVFSRVRSPPIFIGPVKKTDSIRARGSFPSNDVLIERCGSFQVFNS